MVRVMTGARTGLMLLVVAVLGAAWWVIGAQEAAAPLETVPSPAAATPSGATEMVAAAPREPEAKAVADAPSVPDLQRHGLPDPTGVQVSGRCVDVSGAPVAGACVLLQGVRGARVTSVSASDGTFSLRCEPAGRVAVQLVASTAHHLETVLECGQLVAGETRDIGDVKLVSGCVVAGRVVDVHGKPVPGVALHTMPTGEAWRTTPRSGSGVTGADGAFTLGPVLAAGRWLLRADPREFTEPALFTLDVGGRHDLVLTLAERREPATITGKVVDAAGKTVAGVDVVVRNSDHVTPVQSGPNGEFRLVGWDHTGDAHLALAATDSEPPDAPTVVAWGSADARLVWRHGTDLEVAVRRQDTGATVPGAQVSLMCVTSDPARGELMQPAPSGLVATNADGLATLSQLRPATYLVAVRANDLVTLEHPRVQAGGKRKVRVEVALSASIERTVTVTSSGGKPLPGVEVGLWRQATEPASAPAGTRLSRMFSGWSNGDFDSRNGTRLGGGFTDAHGRCVLRAPGQQTGRLRVVARDHCTLLRDNVVLASQPEPWIEVLAVGAVVEGQLDLGKLPLTGFLQLERCDGMREVFPERHSQPVFASDGSFRLSGVPPGSWRLRLLTQSEVLQLADVFGLRDNETRRVEIDMSRFVTAEVSGALRWNGRPYTLGFQLVRVDSDPTPQDPLAGRYARSVTVGSQATFHAKLFPGRYRAAIGHGTGGYGQLPSAEEIVLAPGSRTECEFNVRTRATRLRLLRQSRPVVGVRVRAVALERFEMHFNPTDDYGCAEFALPLGVHPLFAEPRQSDGAAIALGVIEVTAGEGPQITVVNVPAEVGR